MLFIASPKLGSVVNMYTNLGSTRNTTVARGVPAILSAPYYLDQTQSYRMGSGVRDSRSRREGDADERATETMRSERTAAARSRRVADPGFPNRDCGTKIGHIDGIWQCFYSAGPMDGVDDETAALKFVLGGEACIWGKAHALLSPPHFSDDMTRQHKL